MISFTVRESLLQRYVEFDATQVTMSFLERLDQANLIRMEETLKIL
jgi:hypothetical protein